MKRMYIGVGLLVVILASAIALSAAFPAMHMPLAETVQYAILETNGILSVFPFPKYKPASAKDAGVQAKEQFLPVSLVEDGYVFQENLKLLGKDAQWLQKLLEEKKMCLSETLLLTMEQSGKVVCLKKEERK